MSNKAKKQKLDEFMVGYQYMSGYNGRTPEDYKTDPETGLRPNENREPNGVSFSSLTDGTGGSTLPPLKVWRDGFWLDEWEKSAPAKYRTEDPPQCPASYEERNIWVVSGEGTPMNFLWRCYEIPETLTNLVSVKHPGMWSSFLKNPKPTWGLGTKSSSVKMPEPVKAKPLPFNLRIRCAGCGHWFPEKDLSSHLEKVCPGIHGETDWGMMCTDCCPNLDQAMKAKEGYPKLKPAEAVEAEEAPAEEETAQTAP